MLSLAYALAWLRAFAFTELVEAPLYRRLLGVEWRVALGASAITHPLLWIVLPLVWPHVSIPWGALVLVAAAIVVLVEAAFFHLAAEIAPRRALLASLVTNAASATLGASLRALLGYP